MFYHQVWSDQSLGNLVVDFDLCVRYLLSPWVLYFPYISTHCYFLWPQLYFSNSFSKLNHTALRALACGCSNFYLLYWPFHWKMNYRRFSSCQYFWVHLMASPIFLACCSLPSCWRFGFCWGTFSDRVLKMSLCLPESQLNYYW